MPFQIAISHTRMALLLRSPLLSYPACCSPFNSASSTSSSPLKSPSSSVGVAVFRSFSASALALSPVLSLSPSAASFSAQSAATPASHVFARPLLAFSSESAAARGGRMGTRASSTAAAPSSAKNVHEFTVKDINGEDVDLSKYKGKVLLIVNVASACGLTTGNYTELADVYSELKDSGLEILAFPCNQFGGQESGTNEQIKEFACTKFKAEYPIFDKIDVNGPNTAPLYKFLKDSKGGGILGSSIKWNFAKFLVDKDGNVVERYAPTTSPKKIQGDIKKLLGA